MKLKYVYLCGFLAIAGWGILRHHSLDDFQTAEGSAKTSSHRTRATSPRLTAAEAALAKRCESFLLIAEGDVARGSASVINVKGSPLIVTNIHVASENPHTTFRMLNGREVTPETLGVPEDRDILVATQRQVTGGLEMSTAVDREVAIGDKVIVLGNSEGGGVVTQIVGKVLGIGPDLVETDAKFVHGNSGGPIIHVKTGKVIALASYADIKKHDEVSRGSQFTVVRRFGFRIDTVPKWRFLTPQAFAVESNRMAEIKQRNDELETLAEEMVKRGRVTPSAYQQGGWVRRCVDSIASGAVGSAGNRRPPVEEFYRTFNSDLDQASLDRMIPYHRNKAKEQMEDRQILEKFFRSVDWNAVRYVE